MVKRFTNSMKHDRVKGFILVIFQFIVYTFGKAAKELYLLI
ncbi:MAG: hypothetical protein ACOYVK_03425 [Bacillota bacterium]